MEIKYNIINKETGKSFEVTQMKDRVITNAVDGVESVTHYVDVDFKLDEGGIGGIVFEKNIGTGELTNERYLIEEVK